MTSDEYQFRAVLAAIDAAATPAEAEAAFARARRAGVNIAPLGQAVPTKNQSGAAERAVASIQPNKTRKTMTQDDGGGRLAVARDVADYLGLPPQEGFAAAFQGLGVPAGAGRAEVVLREGEQELALDEQVFGPTLAAHLEGGKVTYAGVLAVKAEAARLGLQDVAAQTQKFWDAIRGQPLVLRPDGAPWTPTPVSAQNPTTGKFARAAAGTTDPGLVAEVKDWFGGQPREPQERRKVANREGRL